MQFDDRLGTVLRSPPRSEAAARTQYRQLLDLLGSRHADGPDELVAAAYARLEQLAGELPATVQSKILRASDLRLRNRALVAWLAEGEPQAAAAALATASLSEEDWLHLIPRLPMAGRGFLRHRRDLPQTARRLLERLGVGDLVLPLPEGHVAEPAPAGGAPAEAAGGEPGIGEIVRRIAEFQKARREGRAALRPIGEGRAPAAAVPANAVDFAVGTDGRIGWADPAAAPLLVGLRLADTLSPADARAMAQHQPLSARTAHLPGPDAIAGAWRIDAVPAFDPASGRFTGYRGRLRRRPPPAASAGPDSPGDRMRQVLHELRTPVGAIQGFAEIIQQQLYGPAPNEYRALAAGIAVDAARLLAGFDEIDRLARLESGAPVLDEGSCDLRAAVERLVQRLEGVLRPRSARLRLAVSGESFTVPLAESDALLLVWRLLATLVAAMAPGETIELLLSERAGTVALFAELPAALGEEDDPFAAGVPAHARAINPGMFGAGFALRLARAEVRAAGGRLVKGDDGLLLELPTLTGSGASAHSAGP